MRDSEERRSGEGKRKNSRKCKEREFGNEGR